MPNKDLSNNSGANMARRKKEGLGSEFLRNYLEGRTPEDLSKHTIHNDRWDRDDLKDVVKEMKAFKEARRQLGNFAPESGEHLMGDDFFAFVKGAPKLVDQAAVEPSHMINGLVMNEAMDLTEFRKVHPYTVGDPIQAAASAASMEPKLEEILDQMQDAQETINEMIQQMAQHSQLQQDLDEYEDPTDAELAAMAGLGGDEENPEGEGDDDDEGQGQPQPGQSQPGAGQPGGQQGKGQGNPQDQKFLIEEQMRRLEEQMKKTAGQLDKQIEESIPHVQQLLRQGMEEAATEAETAESAAVAWGLDPGGLKRLPPEKRLELAEKLNSEKFRKIAELFGSMTRLAMAEQDRKVYHAADEIFDIEMGNDLERMMISEGVRLAHPALRALWMRDYVESGLTQYQLRGVEKVAKGSIIVCEDGSGSMGGAREVWAKAVALCLARICREQKRDFHAIHFGGTGEMYEFDFQGSGFDGQVTTHYSGPYNASAYPDREMSYIDGIVHFAEVFFCGGPLRVDQRCVTPDGWKPIGEMQVGDQVIAHDGLPANVTGVYPQGELDLYKVTFKDGAEVICDGTHIWTVQEFSSGVFKDLTLNQMLERGLQYKHDNGQRFRFSVPMGMPVEMTSNDNASIHPYLLGYLLGDGTLGGGRSVSIASSEGEHPWDAVLPDGVEVSTFSEPSSRRAGSYGLTTPRGVANPVIDGLVELGLHGVRGADKFVPESYLWGSIQERLDLLSGLLDADGYAVKNGGFEFSNISKSLCDAVVHLAQSLGGVATIRESHIRENEQPCWTVLGRISETLGAPFKLSRKVESYVQHSNAYTRSIVSAERVETAEAICIKIDRNEGLFMTEGFVVTHNTDFVTPLSRALQLQVEQFNEKGRVDGDIIFITDGQCGVSAEWLDEFKREQERLNFRVWGVLIDSYNAKEDSEPLNTICDGRVFTIEDLTTGEDLRDMFRNV